MQFSRGVLSALLLLVLLGGCSVKFAYNNLDRLVRWQVSDYVDLNPEQRALFKRELNDLLAWHRSAHLPQYADFARKLSMQLVDAPTVDTFDAMFVQMFAWADEVETQATPMIVDIMVSLTDEQIEDLRPRLEKSNVEFAEDEEGLELEEAQARWVEEFSDGLKTFVGRLNRQQKNYVLERAGDYRPQLILWRDYRVRFQAALLELLEERHSPEFAQRYTTLIEQRKSFYGDALTEAFAHNERLGVEISAHLFSTLTKKQTNHLVDWLNELGEDFDELAAKA